MIIPAH